MNSLTQSDQPDPPKDGVPPELIQQLHEANKQFRRAREHVDQAIDAEINSLAERKLASHEVREAEDKLENIDEQISKELKHE